MDKNLTNTQRKRMKKVLLFLITLLCCFSAFGQVSVDGVVTEIENKPLIGVTVMIKGSADGTVTDRNGEFKVMANPTDTLIFRYVGYQQKALVVGDQRTIKVQLETSSSDLNQVVVVGFGTQRKANLVGSVSSIQVDQRLASRSSQTVSSALGGLAPGLEVTQSSGMAGNNQAKLLIRGMGTVNNSSPLIVVDGMPDVNINALDMNDIASISVLKDAASAAVYGSRAANGVILITTKSGKGNKTATINFTGSYAVEQPVNAYAFLADYPRALTALQRAAAVNTLPSNQLFKNGTIDQWMALGMINPLQYPNTDWWDIILRDGVIQNYNLSASGGGDRSNFYISVGMKDESGLQVNNYYKQYNARFSYDYELANNMTVGVKFYGDWWKRTYAMPQGFTDNNPSNGGGFDMQYSIAGITPYDPATGYFGGVMAYNQSSQANNPYRRYVNSLKYPSGQDANVSAYWGWEPVPGLTANVNYALTYSDQFNWSAEIPSTYYNFQTNSFGNIAVADNAGVSNQMTKAYQTLLSAKLDYHKIIGKNHDISVMFAFNEEYWNNRSLSASRNDRIYPDLHEIDAALASIQSTGGNSSAEGLRSYIGRLNYTAFDKYLFEANFRYDGSSLFAPGYQYGFFPSAAVGWRFTQERFINKFTRNFLSSGKLRTSYGSLGNNSGVSRYEQQETLATHSYMANGSIVKGFTNNKAINRTLSWEQTNMFDVGLDLGFLNDKLTATFDYYNRLTTGMIRPSSLSIFLSGALSSPRINIGSLRNRGFEADVNWRDNIGQVSYRIGINASYNSSSLEKWNQYLDRGDVFIGMPYHFLYGYEDLGLAQTWQDVYNATPQGASPGDILRKDLNGDGRIDGNDKRAYPNRQTDRPTTFFALNSDFSWKGIDVGFLMQGSAGRWGYWLTVLNRTNLDPYRQAITDIQWKDAWTIQNRNPVLPRLNGHNNNEQTSFWLYSLRYLRLKNFQVGYNLPARLVQKAHIGGFRLYASAENLLTLTSWPGLDPEIQGDPNGMYPLVKSYSIGVNITF